jgi:methionine-S-sulfoxide reductase
MRLFKAVIVTALLLFTAVTVYAETDRYMEVQNNKVEKVATFGGGCFWCMQPPFDKTAGVFKTIVGYTGGEDASPTYQEVSTGKTGHYEAVEVYYDPEKVSYQALLQVFWENIDPTQADGQFADRGTQYLTAIFFHDDEQKKMAEESKEKLQISGKFSTPIQTRILPAEKFYPAEEYHQDYYKTNSLHYQAYKYGSGREGYLKRTWGK